MHMHKLLRRILRGTAYMYCVVRRSHAGDDNSCDGLPATTGSALLRPRPRLHMQKRIDCVQIYKQHVVVADHICRRSTAP